MRFLSGISVKKLLCQLSASLRKVDIGVCFANSIHSIRNSGIHAAKVKVVAMGKKFSGRGPNMTNDDRHLIVETLGEMRQLKGEMKEFREHVIGRVEKLEKKEGERSKERISILSVCISAMALAISIIINFFRRG
jgi:hypothetical protein